MFNLISKKKAVFGLIVSAFFLIAGRVALAEYQLHEQIPGQEGQVSTLQQYLEGLYKFGIAIVAILAVVMVAVGAFMYIVTSAGNVGKLANAKEIITNALVGLVMALVSWLILFVINPDLVGTTLDVRYDNAVDWVGDGESDATQCNQANNNFYENGLCKGDKYCVGDQCVYKKDFCPIGSRVGGADSSCYTKDFAKPGEGCGPTKAEGTGFVGFCSDAGMECPDSSFSIVEGKQCIDSICCMDES